MRSTRGERYRSRLRSEERQFTIGVAKKVSDLLDNYVLARRGELNTSLTQILWGRIAVVALAIFLALFFLIHLIVK